VADLGGRAELPVRHLGVADCLIYGAAGLFLLLPVGAFAQARWFNLAGGATQRRYSSGSARAAPGPGRRPHPRPAAPAPAAPSPTDRAFLDRMGVRGTGEGE
jgi:hypothetical protein